MWCSNGAILQEGKGEAVCTCPQASNRMNNRTPLGNMLRNHMDGHKVVYGDRWKTRTPAPTPLSNLPLA